MSVISVRKLLKAIRLNCVECSGGSAKEVTECSMKRCALYPYRMGLEAVGYKKEGGEKRD